MVLLENTKENENIDKVYMPVYVLKGDKTQQTQNNYIIKNALFAKILLQLKMGINS